ncbi:MAG: hypothetical protein LBM99_05855 [Bacillales bacterium]|jgi:nitrogen regulatory protein PII|nr:hypothetical protein [Bacillales bacterium]
MKALFIIINAGFAEDIVEIARSCGARGATVINARGTATSDDTFLGIHVSPEKEIVLSLVEEEVAEKTVEMIEKLAGNKTSANGICFYLPVDLMTNINAKVPVTK